MTLAYQRHIFRDGDQINPDDINRAEESVNRDWVMAMDRRYFHSHFRLPLDSLTNASAAALRTYTIDADLEFKVRKIELYIVSSAAAADHTMTISNGTDSVTATVTGTASTTALAYVSTDVNLDCAFADTVTCTYSASAAVTVNHGWAVIHIVSDRQVGALQEEPASTAITPLDLKSGDTMTAASFTAQQTAINSAETAEAGRYLACTISILNTFTDNSVGWDDDTWGYSHLPACMMALTKYKGYLVSDVGRDMAAVYRNESGTGLITISLTGAGSTTEASHNPGGSVALTVHDPEDTADDHAVDSDQSGAGSVYKHYVLLVST